MSSSFHTEDVEVYMCPACKKGITGHLKYAFKPEYTESAGSAVMSGQMHLMHAVIDSHNCMPPNPRAGEVKQPGVMRNGR